MHVHNSVLHGVYVLIHLVLLFHYLDPDNFIREIQTFDFPAIIPIVCRLFQIEDDSIALEGDEGFNVMITAVSLGATIGEATSDITILDDDSQLQIWCIIFKKITFGKISITVTIMLGIIISCGTKWNCDL